MLWLNISGTMETARSSGGKNLLKGSKLLRTYN